MTHAKFDGSDLYDVRFEACNLTGAASPASSFAPHLRPQGRADRRRVPRLQPRPRRPLRGAAGRGAAGAQPFPRGRSLQRRPRGRGPDRRRPVRRHRRRREAGGRRPARRRGQRPRPAPPGHLPEPEDHRRPAIPPARRDGDRRAGGVAHLSPIRSWPALVPATQEHRSHSGRAWHGHPRSGAHGSPGLTPGDDRDKEASGIS